MPEGIVHARSKKHPSTTYVQFEPKREKKEGLGSAGLVDTNPGFSPIARWMVAAFTHEDFVSTNTGHQVEFQLPTNTIALRAFLRIDEEFDNASAAIVGDADDTDGWVEASDITGTTGLFLTHDADYQPAGGANAGRFYPDGKRILLNTANATAPTEGKGLLFMEVVSYHEPLEAEG